MFVVVSIAVLLFLPLETNDVPGEKTWEDALSEEFSGVVGIGFGFADAFGFAGLW